MEESTNKKNSESENKESFKAKRKASRGGFNLGRILLGLILVFVGVVYFLKTTGLIDIQLNIDILQLWPLLIIFAGLSMISFRGWLGAFIGVVLAIAILAVIAFGVLYKSNLGDSLLESPIHKEISIDRGERVNSANISVKFGAGDINIKGGSGEKLVTGLFESSFSDMDITEQTGAGVQRVLMESTRGRWYLFQKTKNSLDLALNQNIPVNLLIDSGASSSRVDLSEVIAESVKIHTGASSLELILGDKQKESDVEIDAGASSISIILPKGVGAKINIDSGMASHDIIGLQKIDSKNWETENYLEAEKKINIEIDMGMSSLNVDWQ